MGGGEREEEREGEGRGESEKEGGKEEEEKVRVLGIELQFRWVTYHLSGRSLLSLGGDPGKDNESSPPEPV